jgi:hypothetical protein
MVAVAAQDDRSFPPDAPHNPRPASLRAAFMPATAAAHHQGRFDLRAGPPGAGARHKAALATAMRTRSLAFSVAFSGLFMVHPGVLVPDIGHLKEVLVQAGLPDGLLEQGLMGPGEQEATTTRLRLCSSDHLLHLVLGVLGAGEQVVLHMDHIGQGGGIFPDRRDIGHPADIDAAVADKDPDAGGLA